MKRPPGLWILLSAGVLWLSLQDVYGIRATALIFGRSTTSTTTPAPPNATSESVDGEAAASTEPSSTNSSTAGGNNTGPVLTGIPQIDYIWDPNLPKELNGYNLSEYPFYERVPDEEIEFKCDGLHDGFYASVPHKCQVYHHCLYGTRYDFLCANYTAFDQKTFICHFVSEVDCVNSKKFWHRNDALYEAVSTTSTASPLRAAIYTPPPVAGDPVTPLAGGARRPPAGGGARRPHRPSRPRRPYYDYYEDDEYDDDYYEERPRSNRGRKRPRPRPIYDDDYEDYEDERYESRRGAGRRRPYRHRRRNKDKRKPEYDEDVDEEVEERFEDDDFIEAHKRSKTEDSRRKQPIDDEEPERDRKRPSAKRRYSTEKRGQDPELDYRTPTRKGSKRPIDDDEYEDELPQSDDSRSYEDRPRKKEKRRDEQADSKRPIIKPVTGTIYDRPRLAPKINLPVPKNAADKFAYKPGGGARTTTTPPPSIEEEEYEDEVEEEPLPKRPKNRDRRPSGESKREKNEDSRGQSSGPRQSARKAAESEQSTEKALAPVTRPKYGSGRNRLRTTPPSSTRKPASEEYYDDEDYPEDQREVQERRPSQKNEKKRERASTTTTTATTTTIAATEAPKKEKHEPVMRVIKRPFLPSRGGNPYSPRGLQPVGLKAVDKASEENDSREGENEEKTALEEEIVNEERKSLFKPSPVLIKVPIRSKYVPASAEAQEVFDSESSKQQSYKTRDFSGPRTTQKPKIVEKNPLDLNEYDVTLNDALNPTLPNLPVRSFPTGFSAAHDYSYGTFQRPRYTVEPAVGASNQNFVVPSKISRGQQRYESVVPQSHYGTINVGYRPQGQTEAIYSSF